MPHGVKLVLLESSYFKILGRLEMGCRIGDHSLLVKVRKSRPVGVVGRRVEEEEKAPSTT